MATKQVKKTRVMASGVFDILHVGHIHYLTEAKKLGDELIVVVASDTTVGIRKKHMPITPALQRVELIRALKPVDDAIVGREGSTYDSVEEVRPDIIALGYDQTHSEQELKKELLRRGLTETQVIRVSEFTGDLNGTRKIIGKILDERCDAYKDGDE